MFLSVQNQSLYRYLSNNNLSGTENNAVIYFLKYFLYEYEKNLLFFFKKMFMKNIYTQYRIYSTNLYKKCLGKNMLRLNYFIVYKKKIYIYDKTWYMYTFVGLLNSIDNTILNNRLLI